MNCFLHGAFTDLEIRVDKSFFSSYTFERGKLVWSNTIPFRSLVSRKV